MKDGKIQGIGFIVAIIFTFIMLTVGRVPTVEEQEQKKEEDKIESNKKEQAKKYEETLMFSESVGMTHSDGTELKKVAYKDRENPDIERFILEDGQTFTFEFQMLDWNVSLDDVANNDMKLATMEMMENIDYDRLKLEDNESRIDFKNLRDFELDEDRMILSFKADLKEDEYGMNHLPINLNLELLYGNTKVIVRKNGGDFATTTPFAEIIKNRTYEDDGRVMGQGNASEKESSPYTSWIKETYEEGEDTTIPLNDGNIEDWDHILDEEEIENGIAADGEGIYD
ncbi:hypothetical protein JNUCC83_08325 [Vagococcus sp. JNUCC 83]